MSEQWQSFENECYIHLKNKYGKYATFTALGQSDSTVPDVLTTLSDGTNFYIETKSPNAQSGQFVLLANEYEHNFYYSPRNSTPFLPATKIIIDYMNDNFNAFVSSGTKGTQINLGVEVFYSWIKDYYFGKGVKFFITKAQDYLIIPIGQFDNYFDVSCCYRMKRSGSSAPSTNNIPEIKSILQANSVNGEIISIGKEYYLKTSAKIADIKLSGSKYTYMFRAAENSHYHIRKLSNTCNSNVIFQISLKKYVQDKDDLRCFEDSL